MKRDTGCSEQQDIISSLSNVRDDAENVVEYTQLLLSFSNWTASVEEHLNEVYSYHVQLLSVAQTELQSKQLLFSTSCTDLLSSSTLLHSTITEAVGNLFGSSTDSSTGGMLVGVTGDTSETSTVGPTSVATGPTRDGSTSSSAGSSDLSSSGLAES